MLFLFLLYLATSINGLVVREIVQDTCEQMDGWRFVKSVSECSEVQFTLNHKYRFATNNKWSNEKIKRYVEQREQTSIETLEIVDASRPKGCFGNGYTLSYFNTVGSSDATCDDDMPCLCVAECANNTIPNYEEGIHLYDNTFRASAFAKHFDKNDLELVWHPDHHDKIHSSQPTCSPCPSGHGYSNGACQKCQPGEFSSEGLCISCPQGKFSSTTSSIECQECGIGNYLSSDQTSCISCKELKLADDDNDPATPCNNCPNEKYSNDLGLCEDCPLGKKGFDCKSYDCGFNQEYDGTSCTDITLEVTQVNVVSKLSEHIAKLPYGEPSINEKLIAQQFINILDCNSQKTFKKRVVKRELSNKIAFLPGLMVLPWDATTKENCKTATRQWEKGQCVIDYETEILDWAHYHSEYVTGIKSTIKNAQMFTNIEKKCHQIIPTCSDTKKTNCYCGDNICNGLNYELCDDNECKVQQQLFFKNVNCDNLDNFQHADEDRCKKMENVFRDQSTFYQFAKRDKEGNLVSQFLSEDSQDIQYKYEPHMCIVDGTKIVMLNNITVEIENANDYSNPDFIRDLLNSIENSDVQYLCQVKDCKHNQLDSNCWCQSNWCNNQYCLFGQCKEHPLCGNENGKERVEQSCTCGHQTCGENQICMNGECLDNQYCPDNIGVTKAPDTCTCGSNTCNKDQYCISGVCKENPICPDSHGIDKIDQSCSCGDSICNQNQFCYHGTCTDHAQCLGFENKTILEPRECRCMEAGYTTVITCQKDQVCYQNACLNSEQTPEKKGRTFFNGQCIKNQETIAGITTKSDCLIDDILECKTDGIHSYNKSCVCQDNVCQPGQYCYFNTCYDNPICPFETPFKNYCVNGQFTQDGIQDSCDVNRWGLCTFSTLLTKEDCEKDARWGYCSNSSILSQNECTIMSHTWVQECTNEKIDSQINCVKHTWQEGCYAMPGKTLIADVSSEEHCLHLTAIYESQCECNPGGDSVTCQKGEQCVNGECKITECEINAFEPVPYKCRCKESDCNEGNYCHAHGCDIQPMCGFGKLPVANESPTANIDCICGKLNADSIKRCTTNVTNPCNSAQCE